MSELLTAYSVLLGVESEARVCGAGDGVQGGGQETQGCLTNLERDILEGQRAVGAGGAVFARAKQEEETDPGEVDRRVGVLVGGVGHERLGVVEDLDRKGFYSRRGRIRTGPGCKHVGEAGVHVASTVEARVGVTHPGERLGDSVKCVAYLSSSDRLTAAAGTAVAYAAGENLEDWDLVTETTEVGVHGAEGGEKRGPKVVPRRVLGGLTVRRDGVPQKVVRKAEISCEVVLGESVRRTQPLGCGEAEDKWVRMS